MYGQVLPDPAALDYTRLDVYEGIRLNFNIPILTFIPLLLSPLGINIDVGHLRHRVLELQAFPEECQLAIVTTEQAQFQLCHAIRDLKTVQCWCSRALGRHQRAYESLRCICSLPTFRSLPPPFAAQDALSHQGQWPPFLKQLKGCGAECTRLVQSRS